MKKKIDERIKTLIMNCIKTMQRAFFIIVGDRGRDQIVNLYYLLTKCSPGQALSILWCYNKELDLSSYKQKKIRQVKALIKKGQYDPKVDTPFDLFLSSADIRYCYYNESHKILGRTFNVLVLQDFEYITPNLLCRTIETIKGGGIIILLLNTMNSLKQLYQLAMNVHAKYRTESHSVVEPRFNERFILSLSQCSNCIAMDDELNILKISNSINNIKEIEIKDIESLKGTKAKRELDLLISGLPESSISTKLAKICVTSDQATAFLRMIECIAEKSSKSVFALTAGRGRGKSAALGLAIAYGIISGLNYILVTSPSPENVKTLFEFAIKAIKEIGYEEHKEFEIYESTSEESKHCVVKIEIHRSHKQIIQYIEPTDYSRAGYSELLVIDEAAAIPLPIVKKLVGNYMVFISSTINGYEGTGRSLSLKLIQEIKTQSGDKKLGISGKSLTEFSLNEPIRYGKDDPVEQWLNSLLCLNATQASPITEGFKHPNECDLYYVNRDTLFSGHKLTEDFLNRLWSLFVSSHYKNTPNDLQLLSDSPAHSIFVLMPSIKEGETKIRDIYCAIHVCYEGSITKKSISSNLSKGFRPAGDLIPYVIAEQFQDTDFATLNGVRIVRIATHPDAHRMGYGSRAIHLLESYFDGKLIDADHLEEIEKIPDSETENKVLISNETQLINEDIKPKTNLKPLLQNLSKRKPLNVHYLGTSYGLTENLFNFWRKAEFKPVYIRQTVNDVTGEHTCVMMKPLENSASIKPARIPVEVNPDSVTWVDAYYLDFRQRLINLLSYGFKKFPTSLVVSLLDISKKISMSSENFTILDKSHELNNISTSLSKSSKSSKSSKIASSNKQEQEENQKESESKNEDNKIANDNKETKPLDYPKEENLANNDDKKEKEKEKENLIQKDVYIEKEKGEMNMNLKMGNFRFNADDIKRLDLYARNQVDYQMVLDLIPGLAEMFCSGTVREIELDYMQISILIGIGLQRKTFDEVANEFMQPPDQILSKFNKMLKKISQPLVTQFKSILEKNEPRIIKHKKRPHPEIVDPDILFDKNNTSKITHKT